MDIYFFKTTYILYHQFYKQKFIHSLNIKLDLNNLYNLRYFVNLYALNIFDKQRQKKMFN